MLRKQFKPFLVFLLALCAMLMFSACDAFEASKPTAVIVSPPSGSQYKDGEEVAVQSASTDPKGIVRIELIVDNQIVRTDASPVPTGQSSLNLIQTWKATPGTHTILVRAYNVAGAMSDPVAVSISVQASSGASSSAASSASSTTSTAASSTTSASSSVAASSSTSASSSASSVVSSVVPECTHNAAFVADVTIPDGTSVNAGQAFNKTWRISNNGTCPWGVGYQLVFVSGEAMTASTVNPVPVTSPGATADLIVSLTAPAPPGNHSGQWKLRTPAGTLFGQSVTVKINVPAPPGASSSAASSSSVASAPPATCSGSPSIPSFTATSTTINKGSSTKLQWGAVTNADAVDIEPGIGGIGTPGDATVAPASTTTYTLTAHCGANISQKQVKITVNTLGIITSINPGILSALLTVSNVTAEFSFKNLCVKPSKQNVTFVGYITTNRSGTVKYKWVTSDGSSSAVTDLVFDKAETNPVVFSHSFASSGWAQLQVTSPNAKNSNQASFTYSCINMPGF